MTGAQLTEREPASSLRVRWDVVVIPIVALAVIALSEIVSLRLAGVIDPDFGDPEFPWIAWQTALLWWSVAVPLALCAGLILGRLVRRREWRHRPWIAALGWTPVFLGFAVVFSAAAADDPAMLATTSAGLFWESFWSFSAWGLGVPLAIAAGAWLTARTRGRVVEQAFRADSRELH